jgi:DNA-binding response OmpR family regulator
MSAPKILVVDSDEGFGFMLQEGLNNTGQYQATWVESGKEAFKNLTKEEFDLVIIDVGLADISPGKLVQGIRRAKSGLKIMMIPMIGQDLPDHLKNLEVDGVLPKPFFVGDLPDLVDSALGRSGQRAPSIPVPVSPQPAEAVAASLPPSISPIEAPAASQTTPEINVGLPPALSIPVVPQETIRYLRANEAEVLRLLNDLNREVRAEAILLIAGVNLIAQAGMLSREQCQQLTLLVAQSSQAAAQAASFLGERAGSFKQSLHEGGAYRLYTLTLAEGILLSLALSTNVPLGMIRHQCRQIAEDLSKYIV